MKSSADFADGVGNLDLPASDATLRLLVDTIPQLAWMAEADGFIFWYNRQWHEYTGTTPEQMRGWGWESVHDKDLLPAVTSNWKTSLATGEAFEMEFPLRGADGQFRWFLTRVNPLRDGDGRILKWCGTNTDIHDQRQARLDAEFLAAVSSDLNQLSEIGEILSVVGERIGNYLDLSLVNFVEVDEARGTADVPHEWSRDTAASRVGHYDLSEYFTEDFFAAQRSGQLFVVTDTETDPRTDADAFAGLGIRSFICFPLVMDGIWRFQCNIHDSKSRDWTAREIELGRELVNRIYLRVERARMVSELRLELANADRLRALSVQVGPVDSAEELSLYDNILGAAIEFSEADAGTIQFVEPETGDLLLLRTRGLQEVFLKRFGRIDAKSLTSCSQAVKNRERIFVDFEEESDDPDGSRRFHRENGILAAQSTPLITRSGELIGMISTHWRRRYAPDERQLRPLDLLARQVSDLIERKRTHEKLAETLEASERQSRIFNTTLSSISDFAYIFDREGRFAYSNKALTDLLGITPDEIVGKNFFDLNYPPDLAQRLQDQIEYVFTTKNIVRDDTAFTNPAGFPGYYEYIFRPVIGAGGEVEFVAGSTRDVSEMRQREEELRQARSELERRVSERTAELADAIVRLREQMEQQSVTESEKRAALKRLVTVQEDERSRIARDIHDGLGQLLTALRLQIMTLKTFCEDDGRFKEQVVKVEETAEKLDRETSFVAWGVRPTVLSSSDFVEAFGTFAAEWSAYSKVNVEFETDGLEGVHLGQTAETNLFRILQEALNNSAKHANASRASVMLRRMDGHVQLIVEDDGEGFDAPGLDNGAQGRGFGLVGMRDRASLLSGTIEIESAKDRGTTIFVQIPIDPIDAALDDKV